MRMVAPLYYTADMVRALPDDGKKYETVYGELLVNPAPAERHERVFGRLFLAVAKYNERERIGALYGSRSDLSWGPDILVQPDLFIVDLEQARTGSWARMQRLMLAVEILSPSSVRSDRFTKRVLYQRAGIDTYWVVDTDARAVEVWTPGATFPVTEESVLRWHPAGAAAALDIPLAELFAPL